MEKKTPTPSGLFLVTRFEESLASTAALYLAARGLLGYLEDAPTFGKRHGLMIKARRLVSLLGSRARDYSALEADDVLAVEDLVASMVETWKSPIGFPSPADWLQGAVDRYLPKASPAAQGAREAGARANLA